MDIFIWRIHMYNIIDGILVIKFSFFVKEEFKFQSFLEALCSMVLCATWGGLRRQAENLKEMRCSCVSLCYYLAPYHFANV